MPIDTRSPHPPPSGGTTRRSAVPDPTDALHTAVVVVSCSLRRGLITDGGPGRRKAMGKRVNRHCRALTTVALATVFLATSLAVGPAEATGAVGGLSSDAAPAAVPPANSTAARCDAPPVGA